MEAREILDGTPGIRFCRFTEKDVVRHPLVQKIIVAYEGARTREAAGRTAGGDGARTGGIPESGGDGR
ncbi:MAG: PhoH family protein [Myxococcota bacterium]|nr:PhoH family protein [Myxococcota bacterium]